MATVTTDQVWDGIEAQVFGVIGMVSARNEARTAGIVYAVHDHKLYVGTAASEWKTRHIAQNPHVSMTIPITKRIPFVPWIKIPAATITFSGMARVLEADQAPAEMVEALHAGLSNDPDDTSQTVIVELTPQGDFVTYGFGVSLQTMRDTELARGRAPVA